jgi:hypothetical protein
MSDRTPFRLDPTAIFGSFAIGLVFVVLFTWLTGTIFGAPTFPLFAMTSGFILAGVAYGYLSEGETVLEPALASILVSVAAYFIIGAMNLQAFQSLEPSAFTYLMVISFLNGIVLTFAGAWTGEKLERTYAGSGGGGSALEWGWMFAGVVLGLAASLFLTNFVIFLYSLSGDPYAALQPGSVWILLLVLFLGLEATGYVCAFRSPGDTSYEALIAGLITIVLLVDVFVFTLGGQDLLSYGRLGIVLLVGLIASVVGGYIGERMQAKVERQAQQAR